jgi:hypothetical protein
MFGNVLSKLFTRGASNAAGSALSRVASNYGDDIARTLATNYGDDMARGTLAEIGDRLATPTISSAATTAAKKSRIGDALVKASDTGLNAPLSLTRKGMREVGDDAAQKIGMLYDRTGLSSMDDLRKLGKELTGGDNSFMDDVTNFMQTNGGRGNFVQLDDIAPQIRDLRDNLPKAIQNQINDKDPAQLANFFKGAAADLRKSATPTAGQKELAKLYETTAREINKRVDMGIDPKYIQQAFDDTSNEFLTRSREALLRGDKKMSTAYKRLAKELAEVPPEQRTVQAYRSFKKDFVDIDKMGKLSDQAQGGGSISRAVKEVPVVGPMLDATLATPVEAGAQKAGEGMRKLGRAFQSGQAQDMLKKGAAIGGGGLVLASLMGDGGGQPQGNIPLPATLAAPGMGGDSNSTMFEDGSMGAPYRDEPTVGGYTRSQLENGYVAALMAGDAKSADAIGSILDIMNNNEKRMASGGTDDAAKKRQAGMRTLNTLLQSYERGGGGQGIIGGTLTNLLNTATGGAYNSSAETYATQARGAAAQIIKALGESGTLSDRDIQAAMDMLPKNTDTDKVAREKISNLMTLLGQ